MLDFVKRSAAEAVVRQYTKPDGKTVAGRPISHYKPIRRYLRENGRSSLNALLVRSYMEGKLSILEEALASVDASKEEIAEIKTAINKEWGISAP